MNRLLIFVCIIVAGCGSSSSANKLKTYKVTGKVSLSGSAVSGAVITFSPIADGKPPAAGVSDAQGMYTLTTYDSGDGAPEGEYRVMVYKPSEDGGTGAAPASSSAPAHDPTGKQGKSAPPSHGKAAGKPSSGSALPDKYAKSDTPIKKTVTSSGPQTIDIDLEK